MNTEIKTKEEWEDEFDKKFNFEENDNWSMQDVNLFIKDLLTSQKEIHDQCEKQAKEAIDELNQELKTLKERLIETLEREKKDNWVNFGEMRNAQEDGWNEGLDKAIGIIKELK